MIIKQLVQVEDPRLHIKTRKVTDTAASPVKRIIADLVASLRYHNLIGIAAPQIGSDLRIFITEVRKTKYRKLKEIDKLRIFINPEIVWKSKNQVEIFEGCGSVNNPEHIWASIVRPASVKVQAHDENGREFVYKAKGLLGRVIQHELDHLDGHEFTEKITKKSKVLTEAEYLKMINS